VSVVVRSVRSSELAPADLDALRSLFAVAWPDGGFGEDDLQHALGGRHWLLEVEGRIVSHASVVERELHVGGRPLRTGYLETVATLPACQGKGFGSRVVAAASEHIRARFELGGLSTGRVSFYQRMGWERWLGPTSMRLPDGALARTEDDDGGILVLRTPATPPLDLSAPISCEWRPGDVW
jgi:aminoglycoside 2'-N-acetyltransferase I